MSLLGHDPGLQDLDLAIILEPTDLNVQLGCVGAFHAEIQFQGIAAHSARPWLGENALTKAGEFLMDLHRLKHEEVFVDGLPYREVVTATRAWTGEGCGDDARNVVPDRFTVYVDHRFAPNKDLVTAEGRIAQLVDGRAKISPVVRAPAAAPQASDATVQKFIHETGAQVEAKQAWTDIARFAALGIPAVNYGPGLTAQAHTAGEYVPVENLHRARRALCRFLSVPVTSNSCGRNP
jgi:succinyl-diaminopimelate desuccinylase